MPARGEKFKWIGKDILQKKQYLNCLNQKEVLGPNCRWVAWIEQFHVSHDLSNMKNRILYYPSSVSLVHLIMFQINFKIYNNIITVYKTLVLSVKLH